MYLYQLYSDDVMMLRISYIQYLGSTALVSSRRHYGTHHPVTRPSLRHIISFHLITSHRITSHRITSHLIASHRIVRNHEDVCGHVYRCLPIYACSRTLGRPREPTAQMVKYRWPMLSPLTPTLLISSMIGATYFMRKGDKSCGTVKCSRGEEEFGAC